MRILWALRPFGSRRNEWDATARFEGSSGQLAGGRAEQTDLGWS